MARLPGGVVISKEQLGARVRSLRERQGITQYKLAKILGTNQSNISNIERGERGVTVHQVVKLAKALHVSTDEILLGGHNGHDSSPLPKDRRVLRALHGIQKLSKRDRQTLVRSIETFLKGAGVGPNG